MTWIDLLRDLGIFTIAGFIIQKIIENSASKNLEKYKQELDFTIRGYQLTLDSDLERYKSELNLHLSRQTVLHEKRLTIIDEMYKKLAKLDSAMRAMTGIQPIIDNAEEENKARINAAHDAFVDYNNYFVLNKLYFDNDTSGILQRIREEYHEANMDFFFPQRLQQFAGGRPSQEGYRAALEKAQGAAQKIRDEIPKIHATLEEQFRKLLGVT